MAAPLTQWDLTAPFEGFRDHLYLDTKGLVTTGVGFMLPRLDDALALPFRPHDQIASDWLAVKRLDAGLLPHHYRDVTRARLAEDWIRLEFDRRMVRLSFELTKIWPAFDAFPSAARMALLDMAWNMGAGALRRNWPHLRRAVAREDWADAAAQCRRKGVQERRNTVTRGLFEASAAARGGRA